MSPWLSFFLEILKISIPALIVFWTVFKLLGTFLAGQQNLKQLEIRENSQKTTLPLKLQAYERLSVLCERMMIPNLILRMRTEQMNTNDLRIAILVALQQEYEHNISQQVYVSDNLWNIVKVAKNNTQTIINQVAKESGYEKDATEFTKNLQFFLENNSGDSLLMAQAAIKQEAATILV
jgi:hypothetical protein